MNRPVTSLVLAGIVTLAACTGDDTAGRVSGPDPVTVPPTTEAPPTTDPDPTDPTTPGSGPDVDETIATVSTTSTTTEPPPTTTSDPTADIEAAIKQARLNGFQVFSAAERDPTDSALRLAFDEVMTGDRLRLANNDLDELASDGLALRPGTPDLSRVVFVGDVELPDGIDSVEAFIDECRVNSDVLYAVATDDRPEAIVDDGLFSYRNRVRFVLSNGVWKHADGSQTERIAGRDAC